MLYKDLHTPLKERLAGADRKGRGLRDLSPRSHQT